MLGLLQTARQHDARIIFAGDTRQIQSVEAGDSLRILERESKLKSVSLTKVERQTNPLYRQVVEQLRRNPAAGFQQLEDLGAVREISLDQRNAAIVEAYHRAADHPNRNGQPSSVLVIAPTHREIARVTDAIRSDRKTRGELLNGITTERYVSLQLTHAQKSDPRSYQPGQLLVFHRRTNNAAKHQAFEVVNVSDTKIRARSNAGVEVEFTTRQVKSFHVFERRPIDIAAGDPLLLTANRRDRDFRATNGEIATVSGFDPEGHIQLQDGRVLPADFKQFAHGYAVTAHRSQGKTVDAVVISADSIHKELFQVAATRGRERIEIVTGNKEALKRSIGISDERQSVTELVCMPGPAGWQRLAASAAREEILSTSAPVLSQKPETPTHANNLGHVPETRQGLDYGINP